LKERQAWRKGLTCKAKKFFRFLFGIVYHTEFLSRRRVYISKDFQWSHFFVERYIDTVNRRADCRLLVTVMFCKNV